MRLQNIFTNPLVFYSACNWCYQHPIINGLKITKEQEKLWGNSIIHDTNNNQWTTRLGQSVVFECLDRLGENPKIPLKKKSYIPDIETDDFIYEVKTRSWTTSGTAGEKVYGTPLKYAEIPILYEKPLIIICVAYQEYEMLYGKTPIFGPNIRNKQQKFIDFYKRNDIYFDQCTNLIELLNEKQLKI